MADFNECFNSERKVFSQSMTRVRKQFEPDSDEETENTMNLLVPHTFKSLNVDKAKHILMENTSCSDEEVKIKKKNRNKKKIVKRKIKSKPPITKKDKEVVKKLTVANEVDLLTEKMQDKIRQEEKKAQSSDSDSEGLTLNLRDRKIKKDGVNESKTKNKEVPNEEIQCSNVDSTQRITETEVMKQYSITDKKDAEHISLNNNVLQEYNEYVNDFYFKMKCLNEPSELNKDILKESSVQLNEQADDWERSFSPLLNPDEPIELLQCEPTLSFLSGNFEVHSTKEKRISSHESSDSKFYNNDKNSETLSSTNSFEWKCYPVDGNDIKLYKKAAVVLEKLPSTFVETYFRFQDLSVKDKDDIEIERLTNLQSLQPSKDKKNSSVHKTINEPSKICKPNLISEGQNHQDNNEDSILTSPEDETECVDELPVFVSQQPTTENYLAKRTLMQKENESDLPIKEEPNCDEQILDAKLSKRKPSSKAKKKPDNEKHEEPLMLTADKMMNKELTLLHTPIAMNDSISSNLTKKSSLKSYSKNISKTSGNKKQIKTEDDSSSEEEKQWVTAKKKRSKRLEKKQEDARIEHAKRAKRVSEFIEKRGTREVRKRAVRGRRLRSRHNFMERQKQLSVLSKELFGEFSGESPHHGKNFSQTLGKGRRNIRKVIDKKSLARSTVLANVEESERKRRLLMRQTSLRELLGCEEGVNVLVINDEVCLEYDFQKLCPMVTVHRFFTKVMKVHQYEGVKFMWDACFESLEKIESGHLGGGCILAHCMGLGKTLQVLALLHTVLTHPRVGMQRVLVCCPLSTVLNWVDEIHKWIGPVTDKIKG